MNAEHEEIRVLRLCDALQLVTLSRIASRTLQTDGTSLAK